MNWLTTSLGVSLSLVLAAQGFICVRRDDRITTAGTLNLVLAAIGLFLAFAVPSGAVVFAAEFGIVLVQGYWTTILLQASIFAGCFCGSLLWVTARKRVDPDQKIKWEYAFTICATGVVTGVVSCCQFWPLNSDPRLTGPLAVSYYPLWFPVPVVWLILCFSQSVLALLQVHDWMDHAWYTVLLIAPAGLYGLGWQEIGDPYTSSPYTRAAWLLLTGASFSAAAGLSLLRLLSQPGQTSATAGWRRWIAAACSLATLGVLDYLFRTHRVEDYREPVMAALLLLAVMEGGAAIRRGYRNERAAAIAYTPSHDEIAAKAYEIYQQRHGAPGTPEKDWQDAVRKLHDRGPKGKWEKYIFSFLVCVVAATLFDLLYFSEVSAGIDLLLGFAAFTVLAEFLAMGAFTRVPGWTRDFADDVSAWVQPVWSRFRGKSPGSEPAPAAADPSKTAADQAKKGADGVASTVMKYGVPAVLALVFLIAAAEAIHHGSTVIEPFSNPDADTENLHPGAQFAKLLVEELGHVRRDIPELTLVSNPGGGPRGGQPRSGSSNFAIAADGASLSAAVPGSNEVDLFGLKIPLGTLATLVQEPVRRLFNVEEITGGIYREKIGNEVVWRAVATSNRGKVWSTRCVAVTESSPATESKDADKKAPASTAATKPPAPATVSSDASAPADSAGVCGPPPQASLATGKQREAAKSASTGPAAKPGPAAGDDDSNAEAGSAVCTGGSDTRRTPIERLAHELAVRMTVDEGASGMTRREDAFTCFDRGVERLKHFDDTGARDALTDAISDFQEAVSIDHAFSDGYFRLADAFLKGDEPVRAAEALRTILDNKPNDVKALLHRATIIAYLRNYYDDPPIAAPSIYFPNADEATQLWYQAAWDPSSTPLQLHAAYFGICQAILTDEQTARGEEYSSAAQQEFAAEKQTDLAAVPEARRIKELANISQIALNRQSRTAGYLPFYFCKRAEAVYAGVPEASDDPDAKSVESGVLNSLGNSIVSHNQRVLRFNAAPDSGLSLSTWFGAIKTRLFAPPSGSLRYLDTALFCDAGDAPDTFSLDAPSPGNPVTPALVYWGNPVSRYAVPYYWAAHRLAPEDTSLNCNYATAALYYSADSGPMQSLGQDLRQRLSIGYDLSRIAHDYASVEGADDRTLKLARIYYEMAVENYGAALALNQESFSAIDDYAYSLFSWSVDARSHNFEGPEADTIEGAEYLVRGALRRLAPQREYQGDRSDDTLDLATTLVEIEMAEGKPGDAVKDLESFRKDHASWDGLISSPYYFLDASYAYGCAYAADPLKNAPYESAAKKDWDRLTTVELGGEISPITGRPQIFSLAALEKLCFPPPKKPVAPPQ